MTEPIDKKYVLISAPASERHFEDRLAQAIKKSRDVTVLRVRDISPGSPFIPEMKLRIQAADLVVTLLPESAEANPKSFVELGAARALEKNVVPIAKDKVTLRGLPSDLNEHAIMYKGNVDKLAAKVLDVLRGTEGQAKHSSVRRARARLGLTAAERQR